MVINKAGGGGSKKDGKIRKELCRNGGGVENDMYKTETPQKFVRTVIKGGRTNLRRVGEK